MHSYLKLGWYENEHECAKLPANVSAGDIPASGEIHPVIGYNQIE